MIFDTHRRSVFYFALARRLWRHCCLAQWLTRTTPSQVDVQLGKNSQHQNPGRPLQPGSLRAQEMKRFLRQVAPGSASHSEANPVNLRRPIGPAVIVTGQYSRARRTQRWPLKRLARQANRRRSQVSGVLLSQILVLKLHSGIHASSDSQRPNGMSKLTSALRVSRHLTALQHVQTALRPI